MYCFEHIPKTAGTSINTALQIYYGKKAFNLQKDMVNILPKDIEIVYGHRAHRTAIKSGFCNLNMITFVREPVSPVKSHFNHIARSSSLRHFININYRKMSLQDYMQQQKFKDFDNGLVRRFSNIDFPYGKCNENYLNIAKSNLEKYTFIGIQEFFHESLFSLSKILEWDTPPIYLNSNHSPIYQSKVTGCDNTISEACRFDISLYEFCIEKFNTSFNKSNSYKEDYKSFLNIQEKLNSNIDFNITSKATVVRLIKEKIKRRLISL